MIAYISGYNSCGKIDSHDQGSSFCANMLNHSVTFPTESLKYLTSVTGNRHQDSDTLNTMSVNNAPYESLPYIPRQDDTSLNDTDGFCQVYAPKLSNTHINQEQTATIDANGSQDDSIEDICNGPYSLQLYLEEPDQESSGNPIRVSTPSSEDSIQDIPSGPYSLQLYLNQPDQESSDKPTSISNPSSEESIEGICSGPCSLQLYLKKPDQSSDTAPNEDYPELKNIYGEPKSIPPESLHSFETQSMLYVPGESEHLDINTVEIIKGSELAHQLGIFGNIKVDKVFYEPGTGAIVAQILLEGKAQSFTLFFIKSETNIEFSASQNKRDKHLESVKAISDAHYKFFIEELNKNTSYQVMGDKENKWRRNYLKNELPSWLHPNTMTQTKQYCRNSDVSSVTNNAGTDISEAIKIRMYQQEDKLAPLASQVSQDNIESALKDIAKWKNARAASQRDAAALNIRFDNKPKLVLTTKQLETVQMLKNKREMAKKTGSSFSTSCDMEIERRPLSAIPE